MLFILTLSRSISKGQVKVQCHRRKIFLDESESEIGTSGYATWFTAGGAIHIAHYDIVDDVITRKL